MAAGGAAAGGVARARAASSSGVPAEGGGVEPSHARAAVAAWAIRNLARGPRPPVRMRRSGRRTASLPSARCSSRTRARHSPPRRAGCSRPASRATARRCARSSTHLRCALSPRDWWRCSDALTALSAGQRRTARSRCSATSLAAAARQTRALRSRRGCSNRPATRAPRPRSPVESGPRPPKSHPNPKPDPDPDPIPNPNQAGLLETMASDGVCLDEDGHRSQQCALVQPAWRPARRRNSCSCWRATR